VQLSEKEMQSALEIAGCFIAGPTETLAPGDKELYKRRDVTATVDSIPLCVGLSLLYIFPIIITLYALKGEGQTYQYFHLYPTPA